MKKLLLGILILAAASALSASDLITRIRVVDTTGTANQEALEQIVYSAIGTKVGENLSLPQLSKDVSALVKTRGIDDVQTKVAEQDDGTLMVTFFISPRQRISDIQVRGCEQFSEKKILRLLKTKTGSMVDEIAQAADRKRIVEKYEKAGYYGTTVGQELTPDAENPGGLVLTYIVDEHPRAKLKGTAFKGNTVFSDSELSSALVTKLMFGSYNRAFGPVTSPNAWICSDDAVVAAYDADPLCGFDATVGLARDLLTGVGMNEQQENLDKMNKQLPIMFISGCKDPVGGMAKGVLKCIDAFKRSGMKDITIKLYPEGRHEMLNERNKDEVYQDVLTWLER